MRCSQLSKTSSSCFAFERASEVRDADRLRRQLDAERLRDASRRCTRRSRAVRVRRTTRRRRSRRADPPRLASDVRVLPTPPEPTSVTSRCARRAPSISAISVSRPMSDVSCSGKLFGSRRASAAAGSRRADRGASKLIDVLRASEILEPMHAEIAQRRLRRAARLAR